METNVDYEQVGRFIYGVNRVSGSFDYFCQSLGQGADPITPDMPVRQFVDRTRAVLDQRYGAGSVIVNEFSETAAVMLAADQRMSDIKAGFDAANLPGGDEINNVLGVPARLEHIRQLIAAA